MLKNKWEIIIRNCDAVVRNFVITLDCFRHHHTSSIARSLCFLPNKKKPLNAEAMQKCERREARVG